MCGCGVGDETTGWLPHKFQFWHQKPWTHQLRFQHVCSINSIKSHFCWLNHHVGCPWFVGQVSVVSGWLRRCSSLRPWWKYLGDESKSNEGPCLDGSPSIQYHSLRFQFHLKTNACTKKSYLTHKPLFVISHYTLSMNKCLNHQPSTACDIGERSVIIDAPWPSGLEQHVHRGACLCCDPKTWRKSGNKLNIQWDINCEILNHDVNFERRKRPPGFVGYQGERWSHRNAAPKAPKLPTDRWRIETTNGWWNLRWNKKNHNLDLLKKIVSSNV